MKLNELGTTGLMDYVNDGPAKTRPLRLGKARKVIAGRFGCPLKTKGAQFEAFCRVVDQEWQAK